MDVTVDKGERAGQLASIPAADERQEPMESRSLGAIAMGNGLSVQIGFWSAVLSSLLLGAFAVAFTIAAVGFLSALEWHGIEAYASGYNDVLMFVLFFPVFLLPFAILVLMVCIHHNAPEDKRILSLLALVFSIVYATQISLNYYIQLTTVQQHIASGELDSVAIVAFFNPHSVAFNLELLGYGMLSIGMVFAAFLFRGGWVNGAIFWILLINGVLNALYIFWPFVDIGGPPIVLALFTYTVPVATALIALQFKRGIGQQRVEEASLKAMTT